MTKKTDRADLVFAAMFTAALIAVWIIGLSIN
jgi:hypothetical protein